MAEFEDIKIVGFDENASGPSGEGALMRMVLDLSSTPMGPWAPYFERAWEGHFYSMKRRAQVSGAQITVTCMPDELQGQIDELNKVISSVNAAMRERKAQAEAAERARDEKAAKERETLSNLKGTLKFD